ncbi:hypothetical protein B7P43_G18156 [Cryptotermes secundus]|uniref:DDE Tnp4 domain-containing protein n=1 Tax=Cryptotermes secundus TaxID=105785 RepID=A0A2J7QR07_9NEOP|nr:hypothetical protein B7P43_G18156 [Cryptotermes secundus]
MKEECIPIPTTEKWYEIAKCFETRGHFPHCIGAVDGKHLRIIQPYRSGFLFFNYKHYFSILLLALADSNYRILYVDVRSYGNDSDCNIQVSQEEWTKLREGTLSTPRPDQFCGVTSAVPYVIVGDEAFVLTNFLLTPYAGNDLSEKTGFQLRVHSALQSLGLKFLTGGDWNTKHKEWGARLITPKRRNLLHTINRQNCKYLSTGEPMYWPTDPNRLPGPLDSLYSKAQCHTARNLNPASRCRWTVLW